MTLAHPKPFNLSDVPDKELKRLKDRERDNRRRAKQLGRKSQPVSVEALLLLQSGICHKSGKPLIFDEDHPDREAGKPVIAHDERLAWNQSKGHVVGNVWLWRHDENAAEAYEREAPDFAKARKMELTREPKGFRERKSASRWPVRGFPPKPENYVSPLSRAGRKGK